MMSLPATWVRSHPRELLSVVLAVALLAGYESVVIGGMSSEIERLGKELPEKEATHKRIGELHQMAEEMDRALALLRSRPVPEGNLALALEHLVARFRRPNVQPEIQRLKGRDFDGVTEEELTDVRVPGLGLRELHDLLRALEELGPSIRIRRLEIQKNGDTAMLRAQIAALRTRS